METDWKPGDIIEFCDEQFEVIKNHGHSGTVKEHDVPNPQTVTNFKWEFDNVKCRLLRSK